MGLHQRAETCYGHAILLGKEHEKEPDWKKKTAAGFTRLMQFLFKQKEMRADLLKAPEVLEFVNTTASILNEAVEKGVQKIPSSDILINRLKNSNFVFSGFKVFHQMNEAFPFLTDENGSRKPFEQFSNEVRSIHEKYNLHYLRAEYEFAVGAAHMAAKWEKFAAMGDRYNLQYRTAGDKRVRESHSKLHNVTLPIESQFWDEYFPPNGWGCRCTAVQVRKGKFPVSDERLAIENGNQATAGKHQEMFRFNPGKQQACFPAYNPYTIKACTECNVSGFKLVAKVPDNEMCRACKIVVEMKKEWQKKQEMPRKEADKAVKAWMKENEDRRVVKAGNLHSGELRLNHDAVKRYLGHAVSQEAKWLLTTFGDGAGTMSLVDYEELGARKDMGNPKEAKNVAEKRKRGVQGYTKYEYSHLGKTWVIGFEKVKRAGVFFEQPYYIYTKKPR